MEKFWITVKMLLNKWVKSIAAIAITLILLGSFMANRVVTSNGKVTIGSFEIVAKGGETVAGEVYKPKNATVDNKLPAIVVIPGFQRTMETQQSISLELARRGIVTITVDPPASGDSTASENGQAASEDGYGAVAVIDEILQNPKYDYIDKGLIGVTGHSAGGLAALGTASTFGQRTNDGLYEKSPVHSAFISGYILGFSTSATRLTNLANTTGNSNLGAGYAFHDEGKFRNESLWDAYINENKFIEFNEDGTENPIYDGEYMEYVNSPEVKDKLTSNWVLGDMHYATESAVLIESGGHALGYSNAFDNNYLQVKYVETEKFYGNPNDRSLRIMYNDNTLHSFQPYHVSSNSAILEFFEVSFQREFKVAPNNQVWIWKELFTLMALVGILLLIMPLMSLWAKPKVFTGVIAEEPEKLPEHTTKLDIGLGWGMLAFGAAVAAISYIPLSRLSEKVFVTAASRKLGWVFPARMTNGVLMWAVFNGLVALIIFTVWYFTRGKKTGVTSDHLGIKISAINLLKTFAVALLTIVSIFLIVEIVYMIFNTDFRFTMISLKTINFKMIKVSLMYIPLFFVFYLSNSIRVNTLTRTEGTSEFKLLLKAALTNSLGLMIILGIQYIVYSRTGLTFWTKMDGNLNEDWLFINILFSLTPLMFILPFFHRAAFKRTGRVWMGPIIMSAIFVLMTLANTVIYVPI